MTDDCLNLLKSRGLKTDKNSKTRHPDNASCFHITLNYGTEDPPWSGAMVNNSTMSNKTHKDVGTRSLHLDSCNWDTALNLGTNCSMPMACINIKTGWKTDADAKANHAHEKANNCFVSVGDCNNAGKNSLLSFLIHDSHSSWDNHKDEEGKHHNRNGDANWANFHRITNETSNILKKNCSTLLVSTLHKTIDKSKPKSLGGVDTIEPSPEDPVLTLMLSYELGHSKIQINSNCMTNVDVASIHSINPGKNTSSAGMVGPNSHCADNPQIMTMGKDTVEFETKKTNSPLDKMTAELFHQR